MKAASASSVFVAALVFWAGIAAAQSVTKTVLGTAVPWSSVNGGLNTAYQFDGVIHTGPTVFSASDGFSFSAGVSLQITYVSGLVSYGNGGSPSVDANGDPNLVANNTMPQGSKYPSYYMSPYPIFVAELVGTFANSSGQIVGTPFAVGDSGTVFVPSGATQLQLGVNDTAYDDNTGAWNIQVSQVPEPATWTLLALGLGAFLGCNRSRHRSHLAAAPVEE